WSSNIGWIQFGSLSGFPTGTGTQAQNANINGNNLKGWARALSYGGGWDGWISLSGAGYGVTLAGNNFDGYAWGSEVVGWVDFDGVVTTSDVANGSCSATHYSCVVGTSINNSESPSGWTWSCSGSNGGTSASCSESKDTIPPISTLSVITHNVPIPNTNITQTTAVGGGTITSNSGSSVTESGIVWDTNPISTGGDPTTYNTRTRNGSSAEVGVPFTGNMTGLLANTAYHVRAYAANSSGAEWGNEVTFTTTGPTGLCADGIQNGNETGIDTGGLCGVNGACSAGYTGTPGACKKPIFIED
ncbi:MAG: hypothetical protein AAB649_05200, partial [Patescibacteria group bacterium]